MRDLWGTEVPAPTPFNRRLLPGAFSVSGVIAQPEHVVMFSGGVGSYVAALRVVAQHGADRTVLVFTDVKGQNPSPHAGEDEDTYRFIRESATDVGAELVWIRGTEDVWDVFRRRRRIGSSYAANCSLELKQKPAAAWLAENCPDESATTVHVGIDWSETNRRPAIRRAYAPRPVSFPMTEPPYLSKDDMQAVARDRGIEPPRLYEAGFPHGNCGGFCVRAGQASFALLLRVHPERYAYHEDKEEALREHLGKDVAILNDRTRGTTTPLTLRSFRERIERPGQETLFDAFDFGGCGCFTAEAAS